MPANGLRSRWVRANGVKTHYTEAGDDGPVVVALHGGGHGSSGAASMGGLLAEMARDFRVVAPDSVGGFGETDPGAPAPHGMLSRVDHTRDFADALCLDRFTLIGHSQGAFTAARFAMGHPERVEKLIFFGSLTISNAMGIEQERTPALKTLVAYDGTAGAMRRMLEGFLVDHSKITDEMIARRQASATRPGAMEAMAHFNNVTTGLAKHPVLGMKMDLRESLPRLTESIPTIFIWGEQDPFALPETGHKLEELLPDVTFHWIPQAGWQVQTDQPAAAAKIVRDFVLGNSNT